MKPNCFLTGALAASSLMLAFAGCAASETEDAPGQTTPEGAVAKSEDALRLHRRPPRPPAAGTGSSCAAPTGNIDAIIKGAQTSDGSAIPQASLPGGCCPAVVAALGFWSCVTLGDACMYSASGTTHHCSCDRVDGEGQLPAWVCD